MEIEVESVGHHLYLGMGVSEKSRDHGNVLYTIFVG